MVCQTKVTIERQMPSHSWRMEKLIVTIMLFIPPMMRADGSKNIECIVPSYQEDMIWFRYTQDV
jgi:hypothetical protein